MASKLSRSDITSADRQQLGYEYQHLYFLKVLLQIKENEIVGYEVEDDIHIIFGPNNRATYIQVKHTSKKDTADSSPKLTKLSSDLWKTLSNWAKQVCDETRGRNTEQSRLEFLEDTDFQIVVNRDFSENEVIQKIELYKAGTISIHELHEYIKNLEGETTNTGIQNYISEISALSLPVFASFINKISFVAASSGIYDEIRTLIKEKMVEDTYIDDIFATLFLQLKEDFFNKVHKGKHQAISYEEWHKKYKSAFNSFRTTLLPFREYSPSLPDKLEEQHFVQELLDIGAIDMEDDGLSDIADFTRCYLKVELQLNDWYEDGKISLQQLVNFHSDSVRLWKRIHKSCHQNTKQNPSTNLSNALTCFNQVMQQQLKMLSEELGISLSNGEFIKLANEDKIRWKFKNGGSD